MRSRSRVVGLILVCLSKAALAADPGGSQRESETSEAPPSERAPPAADAVVVDENAGYVDAPVDAAPTSPPPGAPSKPRNTVHLRLVSSVPLHLVEQRSGRRIPPLVSEDMQDGQLFAVEPFELYQLRNPEGEALEDAFSLNSVTRASVLHYRERSAPRISAGVALLGAGVVSLVTSLVLVIVAGVAELSGTSCGGGGQSGGIACSFRPGGGAPYSSASLGFLIAGGVLAVSGVPLLASGLSHGIRIMPDRAVRPAR